MSYNPSISLFKQASEGEEGWRSSSWRWVSASRKSRQLGGQATEGFSSGYAESAMVTRKKVMVVVDQSSHSKHAMMWALTHAANKGDTLTLLHVAPPLSEGGGASSTSFVSSLGAFCNASRPEVNVEAIIVEGPKFLTVMSQVKKLEVAVLVLGQKKHSPLLHPLIKCLCGRSASEEFVEDCIHNAECLTIGVRKQSSGVGGYLISTKWQKDFWLLA